MRLACALMLVLLGAASTDAAAAEPAALANARALYNAGRYDAAIDAAATARREPPFADAAALVSARAHLERFRHAGRPEDLAIARETLGSIRASALSARDHIDLQIGLGQTLYFGQSFGPAAELFDTALAGASLLSVRDRIQLLDWWASALDREAQSRPPERRPIVFARISARMHDELEADPGSPVANYWLAAATRGEGDLERAWDLAVAAWVRAALTPEATNALRADLERLVTQAIIPELARTRPAREQPEALTAIRADWEMVKQGWK